MEPTTLNNLFVNNVITASESSAAGATIRIAVGASVGAVVVIALVLAVLRRRRNKVVSLPKESTVDITGKRSMKYLVCVQIR